MPAGPEPTVGARSAALAADRRLRRLHEDELARRLLFAITLFLGAFALSVLTPFVFSSEYFRDGAYIVGLPGSATSDADSYELTAFLLGPIFRALQAAGIDLARYGFVYDLDMLVTNTVFGVIGFVFVVAVMLGYQLPRRYGWEAARLIAVVVLLGPFVFLISKETVALVVCGVVLVVSRALRWPPWGVCLAWAGALAALQPLRAYYLATAVIIVAGYFLVRSPWRFVAFYAAFCISLVVAYPFLPLDDITAGRAEALADVSGSRINYPVDDSGPVGFMISRTYAFLALLFPVELGLRSFVYLPYVALQLVMTVRIVQVVRARCTGMMLLAVHTVLAFTAVGALYEPDYGSYFRHKIGTLLFLLFVMSEVGLARRRGERDEQAQRDDDAEAQPQEASGAER